MPSTHKAQLPLECLSGVRELDSAMAALRLNDIKDLSWECVILDLFQEVNHNSLDISSSDQHSPDKNRNRQKHQQDNLRIKANATIEAKNAYFVAEMA